MVRRGFRPASHHAAWGSAPNDLPLTLRYTRKRAPTWGRRAGHSPSTIVETLPRTRRQDQIDGSPRPTTPPLASIRPRGTGSGGAGDGRPRPVAPGNDLAARSGRTGPADCHQEARGRRAARRLGTRRDGGGLARLRR